MKNRYILPLLSMLFFLNSCSLVEGIFKAGAYTGIIVVIIIIIVIVFIISFFRRKT